MAHSQQKVLMCGMIRDKPLLANTLYINYCKLAVLMLKKVVKNIQKLIVTVISCAINQLRYMYDHECLSRLRPKFSTTSKIFLGPLCDRDLLNIC